MEGRQYMQYLGFYLGSQYLELRTRWGQVKGRRYQVFSSWKRLLTIFVNCEWYFRVDALPKGWMADWLLQPAIKSYKLKLDVSSQYQVPPCQIDPEKSLALHALSVSNLLLNMLDLPSFLVIAFYQACQVLINYSCKTCYMRRLRGFPQLYHFTLSYHYNSKGSQKQGHKPLPVGLAHCYVDKKIMSIVAILELTVMKQ